MDGVLTAVLTAPFGRRLWREVAYVVATLPLAVALLALGLTGVVAVATSAIGVGLPLLVVVLVAGRGVGRVVAVPAERLVRWTWPAPPPLVARSPLDHGRAVLTDRPAWRGLAYTLVALPLTLVTALVAVIGLGLGTVAATAPLWWLLLGRPTDGRYRIEHWPETLPLSVQGGLAILATPWVVHALIALLRLATTALLAEDPSAARIDALIADRQALADDGVDRLRRLERNLHDGTQARLLMIGLTLGRLRARTHDPDDVELVASAQDAVRSALEELRQIIRDVGPPALDDGLATALATLAADAAVRTRFVDRSSTSPPPAAGAVLYFAASELLGNVVRHAHAQTAEVRLVETDDDFLLTVTDDGAGGARASGDGSGLDGIRRRARAFDGWLDIDSPAAGPTVVTVAVPRRSP